MCRYMLRRVSASMPAIARAALLATTTLSPLGQAPHLTNADFDAADATPPRLGEM